MCYFDIDDFDLGQSDDDCGDGYFNDYPSFFDNDNEEEDDEIIEETHDEEHLIYVHFWFDIGFYTGADDLYVVYPARTTDRDIEEEGKVFFYEHCEDYSHLLMAGVDEEISDDEWEEEWKNVIENCNWGYEYITKEEYAVIDPEEYIEINNAY